MCCCQTAMEIDSGKHSVIYLASALTNPGIDLPKLKTRHASEGAQLPFVTQTLFSFPGGDALKLQSQVLYQASCPLSAGGPRVEGPGYQ